MIKSQKNKKKILVPDSYEDHESIKAPELDVNKKIIYTSLKHYLKCFKKNPNHEQMAVLVSLMSKLANAHSIEISDAKVLEHVVKLSFKKNIVELVSKKGIK